MILKNKGVTNGSIINIGSVISKGNIGQTVYSTSKAHWWINKIIIKRISSEIYVFN